MYLFILQDSIEIFTRESGGQPTRCLIHGVMRRECRFAEIESNSGGRGATGLPRLAYLSAICYGPHSRKSGNIQPTFSMNERLDRIRYFAYLKSDPLSQAYF
jgi:hypothetical protein